MQISHRTFCFSLITLGFFLCLTPIVEAAKGPTWRYVKVDQFEIVSTLSEKELKKLYSDIHYFNRSLEVFFSKKLSVSEQPVSTLVLRTTKELSEFIEEDAGSFIGVYGGIKGMRMLMARKDPGSGTTQRIMYHEITHRYIDALNIPRWANEGLAGFFETIDIQKKKIVFGGLNNKWVDYYRNYTKPAINWDMFFNSTHGTWHGGDAQDSVYLYSTSWFFTHMCWLGDSNLRKPFLQFCNEPIQNEYIFRKHFGFGYKELSSKIGSYASSSRHKTISIDKSALPEAPKPMIRKATPTEINNAKIRAHALAKKQTVARALLFDQPEDDLMSTEARAIFALFDKDQSRANEYIKKAIAQGTKNPILLVASVDMRLSQKIKSATNQQPQFTPQEVSAYISELAPALRQYRANLKAVQVLIKLLDVANAAAPAQFEPMFKAWENSRGGGNSKTQQALNRVRSRS